MTSERKALLLVLPLALLACGNYSNEDLEFMNALPTGDALRADIPAVSPLAIAEEADLAKRTHETTRNFNGLLNGLVGIVDLVRSLPPTSRTPDSRTWGPFPPDAKKAVNRDWWTRMIMRRNLDDPDQFDYEISVHKLGNGALDWPVLIRGSFLAGQTARRGTGHVELVTSGARAEGMDLTDFGTLDHLEINYDTVHDPVVVEETITALPETGSVDPPPVLVFTYKANAVGQGQMTFDLFVNIENTGPALEDINVTAQWLPTGEGRAQSTIVSGDGMGLHQTQCWDTSFRRTFEENQFDPGAAFGADPSVCPDIPVL
jgi:hypothetical protein